MKVVVAALLFSTGGAAIKLCGFEGWQLAACRAGIACLTILALVPEARRGWSWRVGLVACVYAATTLLYVQANKHTTAASAIFLQSTSPFFILVLAPWLLGERVSRRDVGQVAVMGLGLALFFTGVDRPLASAPNPLLGNVLAACCALTWAFTLIGYRWLVRHGTSVATAAAGGNLIACLVALASLPSFATGRPADWAVVAYLGVVQLGVPYVLLTRAVPRVGALEVSLLMLIEPVLNPVWAWLVHGETPGAATLAGGALILGASAVRSLYDARFPLRPGTPAVADGS